jgi:hypothetical protein
MFTTAGMAFPTASLKVEANVVSAIAGAAASLTVITGPLAGIHSGLKSVISKKIAKAMVTVWAKVSHNLRISVTPQAQGH